MKHLKLIPVIALIVAIVSFSACKKTKLNLTKSSTVQMTAVNPSTVSKAAQSFSITSASVNIANIQIEENSGNDGENVGDNSNDGNDTNEGTDSNESTENDSINGSDSGDILLAGPYVLDVTGGSASIGQINVYPGTFKKVDFEFQTSSQLNDKSIVISGYYTTADGTQIPFTLESAYAQQVQLPLAGSGVTVSADSTVNINIVFDINAWLSNIDFASAAVTNGEIIIDTVNNSVLLSAFEANLNTYAEQGD